MACSCTNKKFVVYTSAGKKYRSYATLPEAEAAAKRIGGTVKT